MGNLEDLKAWEKKVSENKKGLDKGMFDDLMKNVYDRLDRYGYKEIWNYLNDDVVKGEGRMEVGVILLRNNSRQIKDKLWSLNRKAPWKANKVQEKTVDTS